MADSSNARIDAAIERGKLAMETEPRAASARYDRKLDRVVVDLTNGCTFAFPPRLAQGLEAATDEQLKEVEILDAGVACIGRHWTSICRFPACWRDCLGPRPTWPAALAKGRRRRKR